MTENILNNTIQWLLNTTPKTDHEIQTWKNLGNSILLASSISNIISSVDVYQVIEKSNELKIELNNYKDLISHVRNV